MSLFLAKGTISSYFFSSSSFHYHLRRHHLALLTPLSLLRHSPSSQTQPQAEPHKESPFLADYLISSFGFSPDRAFKYASSEQLTAIKSSERPESVVRFLKDTGLSDDQIKAVVSFYPPLLGSNVEKTLKPRLQVLMDAGFSGELLVHLIRYNPSALLRKYTLSHLLFWKDFLGKNNQSFVKIIQRNGLLMSFDIDKYIVPRINLLKEYGLSNQDIVSLLGAGGRCWGKKLASLRQALELVEEMGISRGSKMFVLGIKAIVGFRKDQLKRNAEFFKVTYGWSEEDVAAAFRKFPKVLACSEDKVKSNMDFLIRKAGFESRSIAFHSRLLGCSLERVLIPRYTVLSALQAKGLKNKCSLSTAFMMTRYSFLGRYVVPYEKYVPGLREAYAAALGD